MRIEVVVRELEAGKQQEVVLALSTLGLRVELGVIAAHDAARRCVERQPRIVAAVDVIGDAEDVEAVPSVQVDELGNHQRAVTPPAVCVELAEQRLDLAADRRIKSAEHRPRRGRTDGDDAVQER